MGESSLSINADHRPISFYEISFSHRCFSRIFLVETGYLVSLLISNVYRILLFHLIFYSTF